MLCKAQGNQGPHAHVVCVWDTMLAEVPARNGHVARLFIRMELCDGTLKRYLESRIRDLNILQIVQILIQILEGLCYCHSKGYVHRDLKPSNGTWDEFKPNS